MATAVAEVKKLLHVTENRERDYFTIDEFELIAENLPNLPLELTRGQLVVKPEQNRDYFTVDEFKVVAELLPDQWLELINGEIVMSPQPHKRHQQNTGRLITLFALYAKEIIELGCEIGGSNFFFEVPDEVRVKLVASGLGNPSDVCPDSSICYQDYLDTDRIPPALLVAEVLSDSKREHIIRDTATKPEIYAALEIPTYWVVDRRTNTVLVHTKPKDGIYTLRQQLKGDEVLPAPGLEFMQITPAQIYRQ